MDESNDSILFTDMQQDMISDCEHQRSDDEYWKQSGRAILGMDGKNNIRPRK